MTDAKETKTPEAPGKAAPRAKTIKDATPVDPETFIAGAEALLLNPAFKVAMEIYQRGLYEAWVNTPLTETEAREQIYAKAHAVADVANELDSLYVQAKQLTEAQRTGKVN